MMITKNNFNTICDIKNCKNSAEYVLDSKVKGGKLFLCKQCLMAMTKEFSHIIVPQSPKNAIKKAMEQEKFFKTEGDSSEK
ncbi:MAG: hypothetical protein RR086_05980 [Clostridia bacterium]